MTKVTYLAAASVLVAVLGIGVTPAEARTARQEALQGHGIYTTSKGLPYGYRSGRRYDRPHGYGYGGYGYRGYARHRRYYDGY